MRLTPPETDSIWLCTGHVNLTATHYTCMGCFRILDERSRWLTNESQCSSISGLGAQRVVSAQIVPHSNVGRNTNSHTCLFPQEDAINSLRFCENRNYGIKKDQHWQTMYKRHSVCIIMDWAPSSVVPKTPEMRFAKELGCFVSWDQVQEQMRRLRWSKL